jgi:hypothetical protein
VTIKIGDTYRDGESTWIVFGGRDSSIEDGFRRHIKIRNLKTREEKEVAADDLIADYVLETATETPGAAEVYAGTQP